MRGAGVTCELGSRHGDPYVFPAGFAEFEHVWFQYQVEFEHAISGYKLQASDHEAGARQACARP